MHLIFAFKLTKCDIKDRNKWNKKFPFMFFNCIYIDVILNFLFRMYNLEKCIT